MNHMNHLRNLIACIAILLFCGIVHGQCPPVVNQQFWSFDTGGSNADHQQTFQVTSSGYLSRLGIRANGGVTGTFTISIYEGIGTGGTLLYSGPHYVSMTGTQYEIPFDIPCDQMPILSVGTTYTYRIQGGLSVVYHSAGSYGNGEYLTYGAPRDMNFRIYISDTNMPVPTLTPTDPTCFAGTDGSITSTVAGGTSPYNYNWDNGPTTQNNNSIPAGTYELTVTDLNACVSCPVSATLTDPPQVTANAGPDVSICYGTNHNMTAVAPNATTYSWSPTTALSNPNILNPIASPTTPTTYTLTASDANGCFATDDIFVNVYSDFSVSAGPDQSTCDGGTITLTGSGTASGYTWDGGITNGVPFSRPPGTYTFIVTGNVGVCTKKDTVDVTFHPLPTVGAGPDQTVCDGDLTTLNGSGAVSYSWDNGVTDGVSFTPPASTLTLYTVTGTDANGCQNTDAVEITSNTLPTVSAGSDQIVCDGDMVTLNGSGAITYSWDGGVSDGVSFTPPGSTLTTYTVTGTDGNGCQNTDMVDVTSNALPSVSAGGNQTLCENDPVLLAGSGAVSYSWDNGVTDGVSFIQAPGSINYTVIGTDANGCQNSDMATVLVNALPNVTFGAISDMCLMGTPYTLTEGSPGGGNYYGTGVSSGIFTPSTAGLGTHWIYYDYTDGNSCFNIDSTTIEVYGNPTVTANATGTSLCDGESLTLNGGGANTYSWDNAVTDGVAFTPAVGVVMYHVTGFDANGCSGEDSVQVTVHALPTIDGGTDQVVCEGDQITLSGAGGVSYSWDNGVTDGVSFVPPLGTTTYNVYGTDANSCSNYDAVLVTVNPLPILNFSPDQIFCLGDTINLNVSGANTYDWNAGDGSGPSYIISPTQSTTVAVVGTSTDGCESTGQIILTLDDPNFTDAGTDQDVCKGFITSLTATGGIDYLWSGPGIDDGNNQTVSVLIDSSAYYYVDITTNDGCLYTDSLYIYAIEDGTCEIESVSSITPNGDGVNDTWRIVGIEGFPDNYVTIYNRWGDIVFEAAGYDNEQVIWDGTSPAGDPLATGTYFFTIQITNGTASSGWIQLMK